MSEKMLNLLIINQLSVPRGTLFIHILNSLVMKKEAVLKILTDAVKPEGSTFKFGVHPTMPKLSIYGNSYFGIPFNKIRSIEVTEFTVNIWLKVACISLYLDGTKFHFHCDEI